MADGLVPLPSAVLLDALDVGVGVVDVETATIVYENLAFGSLLPAAGTPLTERLRKFDGVALRSDLTEVGLHTIETEIEAGDGSKLPLKLTFRPIAAEKGRAVVEILDLTREREAEYMLDSYSRMAERHALDLKREKERAEKLLLNLMPRSVYEELKQWGTVTPQRFERATVLLLDFVDFTEMAVAREPTALVSELNDIFTAFDRIVDLYGCERIKTIGDAYLAVAGMPEATPDAPRQAARVALRIRRYLERRNASSPNAWIARIGIATGPLIGSLVGVQKYLYDVFGPAVNLASRIESVCPPMEIAVCGETRRALGTEFLLRRIGDRPVKGFGEIAVHLLEGESE